jgi:hypothetical protein
MDDDERGRTTNSSALAEVLRGGWPTVTGDVCWLGPSTYPLLPWKRAFDPQLPSMRCEERGAGFIKVQDARVGTPVFYAARRR